MRFSCFGLGLAGALALATSAHALPPHLNMLLYADVSSALSREAQPIGSKSERRARVRCLSYRDLTLQIQCRRTLEARLRPSGSREPRDCPPLRR